MSVKGCPRGWRPVALRFFIVALISTLFVLLNTPKSTPLKLGTKTELSAPMNLTTLPALSALEKLTALLQSELAGESGFEIWEKGSKFNGTYQKGKGAPVHTMLAGQDREYAVGERIPTKFAKQVRSKHNLNPKIFFFNIHGFELPTTIYAHVDPRNTIKDMEEKIFLYFMNFYLT